MKQDFDADALRKRLDALILLLLENSQQAADTVAAKIERLRDLGFTNSEMAQMLGKPPNYIGAVVSRKRSGSRTKEDSK
jgi:hypothetical protein